MTEDIEVIEVNMNAEDIEELIGKLNELVETKGKAEFELAEDLELHINYDDSEEVLGEEQDD